MITVEELRAKIELAHESKRKELADMPYAHPGRIVERQRLFDLATALEIIEEFKIK